MRPRPDRRFSWHRPLHKIGRTARSPPRSGRASPRRTRAQEALALHALVNTTSLSAAGEVEAEQESAVTLDRWRQVERERTTALFDGDRSPLLAAASEDVFADLDGLFEYALARHLDGFAVLVGAAPG